jgi:hypothetical protein
MNEVKRLNNVGYIRSSFVNRVKFIKKNILLLKYYILYGKNVEIYLITFHQSGTHWLRSMISNGLSEYYNFNFVEHDIKSSKKIIPSVADNNKFIDSEIKQNIRHSHQGYSFIYRNKSIILLIRDIRDALISQYEKYSRINKKNITFSEFLRKKSTPETAGKHTLGSRVEFLNSWYANRNKVKSILIIKYEDLIGDLEEQLRRIFTTLGISNDQRNIIRKVIESGDINNMTKLDIKNVSNYKDMGSVVNQGVIGRHSMYFDKQDYRYFNNYINNFLIYNYGYDYTID